MGSVLLIMEGLAKAGQRIPRRSRERPGIDPESIPKRSRGSVARIPMLFGIKSGSWRLSPLEIGIAKKNISFHILKCATVRYCCWVSLDSELHSREELHWRMLFFCFFWLPSCRAQKTQFECFGKPGFCLKRIFDKARLLRPCNLLLSLLPCPPAPISLRN